MRAVVESAGITNILTKSLGSDNAHNVVRATFTGLMTLKDPVAVARMRGKSLEELFGKPAAPAAPPAPPGPHNRPRRRGPQTWKRGRPWARRQPPGARR